MSQEVFSGSKLTIYDAITNKIVDAIEAGTATCRMPWHSPGRPIGIPVNATTYTEYRGVNVLTLWITAATRGYSTGEWASYKQWQSIDAQVRRGEQGTLIVFYKQIETSPMEDADPDRIRYRFLARPSWVFNAAQVDGYQPIDPREAMTHFDKHEAAEGLVLASGAKVEHGHSMACYRPGRDVIEMPKQEWFMPTSTSSPAENYYAVLLHELTHWTGAEHRLKRDFGRRFGDTAYAMEELVAELGSAFLCAALGISSEPREDHANYVGSWLEILKRDKRAIFKAASMAQEAYSYLSAKVEGADAGDLHKKQAYISAGH